MSVTVRQSLIGVGYTAQSALDTINLQSKFVRLNKLNASLWDVDPVTENNAQEIGKGSEFADDQFTVNWNCGGSLNKYLSSEMAAWLFGFGLGASVSTVPTGGTLSHQHVATILDQTAGLDLPAFSIVEQIQPGGSAVIDRGIVGNVLSDFKITVQSGPGRASSQFTANCVGTGKVLSPSTITLPGSSLAEHLLPAGGLSLTVNGVDYISSKRIIDAEFSFNNNVRLDSGFYPGSGFQTAGDATTGQIRGRMEFGDRTLGMTFTARFNAGSPELASLLSQTEGAIAWTQTGALIEGSINHAMTIAFPRARFAKSKISDKDGIVIVACEMTPLLPTDGSPIVTCTVVNTKLKVAAEA